MKKQLTKADKRKMKELTEEKLYKILEEHKHWINEDCKNWEEMRADLRDTNLSEANLRNAILRGAYLRGADLSVTDLLRADLYDANLRGANLHNADLRDANLSEADLRDTNLRGADLSDAKNVPYIPTVCPEEGDFIGWKKADSYKDKVIVKLRIPSDAKRSSATTRKCRCSKAEVIAIYNLDGTVAEERKCYSEYDNSFIYEVGKTVEVTDFDNDRWNECAKGIHFFISRQEAINY